MTIGFLTAITEICFWLNFIGLRPGPPERAHDTPHHSPISWGGINIQFSHSFLGTCSVSTLQTTQMFISSSASASYIHRVS